MDYFLLILSISLLVVFLSVGWALTLMGMPGNWLMVAATSLYSWLVPANGVTQITWNTVFLLAALAILGEVFELAASVWGARRAGGSRRAAVFSLVGSIAGALLGATAGLPIPIAGPPLAALLGGAFGALTGAAVAEYTRGESSGQSVRVGVAAFLGRLLGTGSKTLIASVMVVVALVALAL